MDEDLAFLALLVAGYALIAARLERLSIGPALVFLFIGVFMSEDVFGRIALEPEAEPLKILAQVTLTLLLFADASTIRVGALRGDAKPVVRLLAIGLLLTIALGSLSALLLFPGISLGIALVIGAALAPTDAALGHAVVTDPKVPARVRRLLNVEGGLNDGIATPFVFLGVALAGAEMTGGEGWLLQAVADFLIGLTVGVLLGLAGGALLAHAERTRLDLPRLAPGLRPHAGHRLLPRWQPPWAAMASSRRSWAASHSDGARGTRPKRPSGSPRRRAHSWPSACGAPSAWSWPASC